MQPCPHEAFRAGLTAFGDGAELDSYLAAVSASARQRRVFDAAVALSPTSGWRRSQGSANENDYQQSEVGVDEGDIVKTLGPSGYPAQGPPLYRRRQRTRGPAPDRLGAGGSE